jgi:saccharopine dehydrogenase-like NADP-dependent oxidoreductase
MKNILVIGAGRSTISLIDYLLTHAQRAQWHVTVADQNLDLVRKKIKDNPSATGLMMDVHDEIARVHHISKADLVVSMLPAHMHIPVAKDCIALGKHMVTASYISDEMRALDADARAAGVVLMNEIGVDPGIDHLSAMKAINEIREAGGLLRSFESFTGGLIAPDSEGDNPWRYKITWNPRNIVMAGSGGAVKFLQEGQYKYIPYHQVFRRTETITIPGYGRFEGYANRDSLKYREAYGLQNVDTIFRGTLRKPGFCRAWDVFVKLGMTDDSYVLDNCRGMSYRDFTNMFLAYHPTDSVELKLMHYLNISADSDLMEKLEWLGLFSANLITQSCGTPAQILQHLLEEKWALSPDDKDMIVMHHRFGYTLNGQKRMRHSSMVSIGKNAEQTAMARTVGLPVAIAVKLILQGVINTPGVHLPLSKEIYEPMLAELESFGIAFVEEEILI